MLKPRDYLHNLKEQFTIQMVKDVRPTFIIKRIRASGCHCPPKLPPSWSHPSHDRLRHTRRRRHGHVATPGVTVTLVTWHHAATVPRAGRGAPFKFMAPAAGPGRRFKIRGPPGDRDGPRVTLKFSGRRSGRLGPAASLSPGLTRSHRAPLTRTFKLLVKQPGR
jgi:hypothetical protein